MKVPIVFTCDNHYFKYTFVTIISIIENRKKNKEYDFFVLSEDISKENKQIAEKYLSAYKGVSIRFINLENIEKDKFHLNAYMTVSTYYRFYIPQLFRDFEKVLYLDSDLIVDNDISELLELELGDNLAACCISPFVQRLIESNLHLDMNRDYCVDVLKMPLPIRYFNAGVMLYNIREINRKNISDKLFHSVEEIPQPLYQDQDLLNSVFSRNGEVLFLPGKYNFTKSIFISKKRILLEGVKKKLGISRASNPFFIYHYVGKDKPWMKKNQDWLLFDYYAKKSPFYKELYKF
jgi:lipopolysaccharide biosynthesis glycosyltransferase